MNFNTDKIALVVGAAGHFAGLTVPALHRRGIRVRGFVRTRDQGEVALRNGASEIELGDLQDSQSVQTALRGTEAVFYIAPQFSRNEADLGINFVKSCKEAGVHRIVFSSILHPTITSLQIHSAKGPVEAAIIESGLEFVILQLAMFYQDISLSWPSIMQSGIFAEPFSPTAKLARVDYRDVADVVAIALTEDRLTNGTFELCAEGYYNRQEVASIMSDCLGHQIKADTVTFEEWVELTKPKPDDIGPESEMYAYYGEYGSPGNSFVLRSILGREPRTIKQFVCDLINGVATVAS